MGNWVDDGIYYEKIRLVILTYFYFYLIEFSYQERHYVICFYLSLIVEKRDVDFNYILLKNNYKVK